jgi:hypothetical protein
VVEPEPSLLASLLLDELLPPVESAAVVELLPPSLLPPPVLPLLSLPEPPLLLASSESLSSVASVNSVLLSLVLDPPSPWDVSSPQPAARPTTTQPIHRLSHQPAMAGF